MSLAKKDVFQAIADPTRRQILRLLANDELPVTVISSHFPMTRTAISKHLSILLESKLVSAKKVGKEKHFKLEAYGLVELKEWLSFYEQLWDNKLLKLKHQVESKDSDEHSLSLLIKNE
jgi:DNA-binding transcriptional ArsR family regulator